MKRDIYSSITNQIVAAIEAGVGSYHMPWHRRGADLSSPSNSVTQRPYRGVNTIMLWMIAEARGYGSGTWATYRQWQERGVQVHKGERATTVVFWKPIGGHEQASTEGEQDCGAARFVAWAYSVFNADQVDGYQVEPVETLPEEHRIVAAEQFVASVPARITYGGDQPCYLPAPDEVHMVSFAQFKQPGFYAVLAHELIHWSGARSRLDRDLSGRFGSEAYAMEELVAELGAAFVAGRLGLPNEPREDHAPYIASWLKVLKGDPRAIFTAASKAQAAADYLAALENEARE